MLKKYIFLIFSLIQLNLYSANIDQSLEKPQKLFIGSPFKLHVNISSELTDSIYTTPKDTLDIFILKSFTTSERVLEDKKITNLDLIYQPFDTGEYTFPELEFAVKTADTLAILKTKEFLLNVESVIADSTQNIKDIAGPIKIDLGFFDYFIPILILLILIFGVRYLIKFLRIPKNQIPKPSFSDTRPAFIIALELLHNLDKEKLLSKGDYLNFYFKLSFILRFFIELQYKINAVEMTTSEIRSNLILDDHKEKSEILDFLNKADLIKFAKRVPESAEIEASVKWLENYLLSFEPAEETNNA
ncbi:MAG: hypothetical protein K9N07_02630 [Candidatus Cloacimonetes bacterium]|nr:hypothetical protein [Candidatus Cloacimonadota bacterium]